MLARRGFAQTSQPEYLFKPEGSEDDTCHQRQDAKRHQALLRLRQLCGYLLDYFVGHWDRVNLGDIRGVMHLFLHVFRVPPFNPHRVATILYQDGVVLPDGVALDLREVDGIVYRVLLDHRHIFDALA